jgi:hypothetical protein
LNFRLPETMTDDPRAPRFTSKQDADFDRSSGGGRRRELHDPLPLTDRSSSDNAAIEFRRRADDHVFIGVGRGVCGTAVAEKRNMNIADVRRLSNYLACSTETRSELVVLIRSGDSIHAQIDIDSHEVGAFEDSTVARVQRGRLASLRTRGAARLNPALSSRAAGESPAHNAGDSVASSKSSPTARFTRTRCWRRTPAGADHRRARRGILAEGGGPGGSSAPPGSRSRSLTGSARSPEARDPLAGHRTATAAGHP